MPYSPAGFAASLSPEARVKNLVKNTRILRPENIHAHVVGMRQHWNNDYGRRCSDIPFDKDDLFRTDDMGTNGAFNLYKENKNHTVGKIHYLNSKGPWALVLQTHQNGEKDWSINVWAGNNFCFHEGEARNIILNQYDEETYKEWKRFVMARFEDDITPLIADARKEMRGWNAWSVTCSDSSTRLMRRVPRVTTIEPGVSFLFL